MKDKYTSNKVETLAEITVTIQRVGGTILAEVSDTIVDDNYPIDVYHFMAKEAINSSYEEDEAVQ